MKIKTKFSCGDQVYLINKKYEKIWIPCSFCGGDGIIIGKNQEKSSCPKCYGNKGQYQNSVIKYQVIQKMTIGEIRITYRQEYNIDDKDNLFNNYGSQKEFYEERYMCYETGISTGTLWLKDKLFATEKEAQKKCDSLNHKEGLV